jgi:hypothetical protein
LPRITDRNKHIRQSQLAVGLHETLHEDRKSTQQSYGKYLLYPPGNLRLFFMRLP